MYSDLFLHADTDDSIFNHVKSSDGKEDVREYINNLWKKYEPYCPDSHFAEEFARNMQSRWWELYLGCLFIDQGFELLDNKGEGPDFRLKVGGLYINVEAIAPSKGTGDDAAPNYPFGQPFCHSDDPMILRLTHAVWEKSKKYKEYLENGIVSCTDFNIVAVNLSKIDMCELMYSNFDDSIMGKAFLGFDDMKLTIPVNLETGGTGTPNAKYEARQVLEKASGSDVSTKTFVEGVYPHISGAFCSAEKFVNCPVDGKGIWHMSNPTAKNPIPEKVFHFGAEWSATLDESNVSLTYSLFY